MTKKRERKDASLDEEQRGWHYRCDHTELRKADCHLFTRYYRDVQKIIDLSEWDDFMCQMRTPLGMTLWVNHNDPMCDSIRHHFEGLPQVMTPIPWYPHKAMGWRFKTDKRTFRKDPELQELRQFIVRHTALGTVSRQEEVSMIPPFLLDVQAGDWCLDMCASPGSKTAQILAALASRHRCASDNPLPFEYTADGCGCVFANEMDEKRANMLVHQCKRLRSLFPFAIFTNHDARYFPLPTSVDGKPRHFDKILLDVVCSGDGTLRKAPGMIGRWTPGDGNSLQKLQLEIALRGASLLKIGGRMVYSTCSLNPIENEAVVAHVLRISGGALRLLDIRSQLPGLDFAPGLNTWCVTNAKGDVASSPGDLGMHENCFPPASAPQMGLEKCARLYPRHCQGGGFFVAVLEKVSPFEEPVQEYVPRVSEKRKTDVGKDEERIPPRYCPALPHAATTLKEYGITSASDFLVTRAPAGESELKPNGLNQCCFVSSAVRNVVSNPGKLIIVAAGLRVLAPENLTQQLRLTNEACPIFFQELRLGTRLLRCHVADILPLFGSLPLFDANLESIAETTFGMAVSARPIGPFCIEIVGGDGRILVVAALRARSRVQLLVDKEDLLGVAVRLGVQHHPMVARVMGQPSSLPE